MRQKGSQAGESCVWYSECSPDLIRLKNYDIPWLNYACSSRQKWRFIMLWCWKFRFGKFVFKVWACFVRAFLIYSMITLLTSFRHTLTCEQVWQDGLMSDQRGQRAAKWNSLRQKLYGAQIKQHTSSAFGTNRPGLASISVEVQCAKDVERIYS